VAVDQPEAFGPVPRRVELDSEEPTEVPRDVALTERFAASTAVLEVGGRDEGGTRDICTLLGASATTSLRAEADHLSR